MAPATVHPISNISYLQVPHTERASAEEPPMGYLSQNISVQQRIALALDPPASCCTASFCSGVAAAAPAFTGLDLQAPIRINPMDQGILLIA